MGKELKGSFLALTILITIALLNFRTVHADPATELAVDPSSIVDFAKGPGSTFTVNITVADVSAMWGFQFNLTYDTNVLTATSFQAYDPFTFPWPSEIDDTAGWVTISYSMPFGEPVGFSTVAPEPIAGITFTVDGRGETVLDLHSTVISDIYGQPIAHNVFDGYFSNKLLGDADGDGDVDFDDFIVLASAFGSSAGDPAYDERADFYRDGDVDFDDFVALAGNFGTSI